jgi:hypothetical protein
MSDDPEQATNPQNEARAIDAVGGFDGPRASPQDVAPKHERPSDTHQIWRFTANDIMSVVLRTEEAPQAKIVLDQNATDIVIAAKPAGGVIGYHSSAPDWKETPAADWGLDLTGRKFGNRLVISSKNEMQFMHHHYYLEEISIRVPSGVRVDLQTRKLTGDGSPDLRR